MTVNEQLLLEYLRSGASFEEVSESHEACQLIAAVCAENSKRPHGLELVVVNPKEAAVCELANRRLL